MTILSLRSNFNNILNILYNYVKLIKEKDTFSKYLGGNKIYKKYLLILFSFSLFLSACDNGESTIETQNTTDKSEVEETEEFEDVDVEVEEEETLEIDSQEPLENIGEYSNTEQGRVELINIVRPTNTYTLGEGLYMEINDVKILHHSEIPESQKENSREIFGFDEEGYTIQIVTSVENTTDKTISGIEPMDIVTSSGNQYNIYDNGGPLMNSAIEVRPNATVNFVGVTVAIQDPEISSLTIYYQPYETEGYNLDESSIEISF